MEAPGLYVHAPFCARRCCYCDFAVTVDRAPDAGPWLDAVESELRAVVAREDLGRPRFATVYVGGGTPSLLGPAALPALRERIERHADIGPGEEWTAEANPESFDADVAAGWKRAGVTRVSFGAQSFDEAVLRWMGRMHGPDGPERAIDAARRAGLEDVGLDLIFGLPARLDRDWAADLERALRLEPRHIALYGLTAEPATPLGGRVRRGDERLADEEAYRREYLLAARLLPEAGFAHYEVSNFARPGHESRHNDTYWSLRPYVGLGPGAHSFLPPRRWWNVRDWAEYRSRIARGGTAVDAEERLDDEAGLLERAWLGLRTARGAALESPAQRRLAADWAGRGWATAGRTRIRLTPEGWLLLDRLAVEYAAAA